MNNKILKSNYRYVDIDIIKGIGILLMVVSHAIEPHAVTHFIGLFHMSLFFIASGYCYQNKNNSSITCILNYIIKKIKTLWIPFFVWNTIFVLLNNCFIRINFYTNNRRIYDYFSGEHMIFRDYMNINQIIRSIFNGAFFNLDTHFLGGYWFIKVLFCISIIFCLINYLINIMKFDLFISQGIISVVFLFFGLCIKQSGYNVFGIDMIFSKYILYYMGYVLCNKHEIVSKWIDKYKSYFSIFSLSFLIFAYYIYSDNILINAFLLLSTAIAGWFFCYIVASYLKRISIFRKLFTVFGQNTLAILTLHIIAFRIITIIICVIYHLPKFCIAAYPNIYGNISGWFILYTIAGIVLPISFKKLLKKVKLDKIL